MDWKSFNKCLCVALNTILRSKNKNKLEACSLYSKLMFTKPSHRSFTDRFVFRDVNLDPPISYPKRETIAGWRFSTYTVFIDILQSEHFLSTIGTRTMFIIECNFVQNIQKHSFIPTEHEMIPTTVTQANVINYLNASNEGYTTGPQDTRSSSPLSHSVLSVSNLNPPSSETNQHQNKKLQQVIQQSQNYAYVDLSRQGLTDEDMRMIAQEIIIKKQCKQLVLTSNKITSIGVSILTEALNTNNTLEILELDDNQICDNGVYSLVTALSFNNNILKKLGLAKNGITDEGIKHLAQMSRTNKKLTQLDLCSNEISDEGIRILANTIKNHNSTIELLWLTSNKLLTDESVDSLIQMIKHNRSLKRLYMFKCNLSKIGKDRLKNVEQSKANFRVYVNSWKD